MGVNVSWSLRLGRGVAQIDSTAAYIDLDTDFVRAALALTSNGSGVDTVTNPAVAVQVTAGFFLRALDGASVPLNTSTTKLETVTQSYLSLLCSCLVDLVSVYLNTALLRLELGFSGPLTLRSLNASLIALWTGFGLGLPLTDCIVARTPDRRGCAISFHA